MIIIKIGGGKDINLKGIAANLATLKEKFIIVHGANAARDELAQKLNIEKKVVTSISGYASVFSDENTIDLMMMAYSGLKNKRIVELLQRNGINAIGLSGLDGRMIEGKRNTGIKTREEGKTLILRDFSGKPKKINTSLLNLLLENGYIPVLCVPIIDENSFAINSENDDIVALLQSELKADKIIQLIEAPGFLQDKNNPDSVIKKISQKELEALENNVEGRMKRKILALRKLFEAGPTNVYIYDGRAENPIIDALNEKGTLIS